MIYCELVTHVFFPSSLWTASFFSLNILFIYFIILSIEVYSLISFYSTMYMMILKLGVCIFSYIQICKTFPSIPLRFLHLNKIFPISTNKNINILFDSKIFINVTFQI